MRFILHKIESIPSTIPRGGPGPLPPLAQEGVGSEGASLGGGVVDHIDTTQLKVIDR